MMIVQGWYVTPFVTLDQPANPGGRAAAGGTGETKLTERGQALLMCLVVSGVDVKASCLLTCHACTQICTVREQTALRSVSIIANDPEAADLEWCHLVTNCTLCLTTSLVTLRLGLLKAQDASFMLALGKLLPC